MSEPSPTPRYVLVRAEVLNRHAVTSIRFVEQNHYRLWQYMMANKHDLIVQKASPCLWLPEAEYAANSRLFDQSGPREDVTRLNFAIYDQDTGLCNTVQRFVPTADADQLRDLLLQRIPDALRASDDFVMEQQCGCAVIRNAGDPTRLGAPLAF
jgi:hypothetical protein